MNDAAWERLTDSIDVNIGIERHGRQKRPVEDRPELEETVEFIEFSRDNQGFRLERVTGPAIIDRKTHFSHRPGVANRIENIYDPSETMHRVTLYSKAGDEWEPIELDQLNL